MPTEKEVLIVQKATVYDLMRIFNENPEKSYTVKELEQLLHAYIQGVEK
ncbi:MAG: hypothetical protein K2M15_00180 [Oscillospiraceae bacterium]|nr:hypothetical protein [Oscillospiraceae bacterium]MDE7171810.1 hypothetical protein [Oscillospiraceae bacterium]